MNLTSQLLDLMLQASNLSRWQFIQQYSIPPLVTVPKLPAVLLPVFGLFYVVIFGLAVFGNGAVLVLLCRKKALQSPSTFFICSLALSDLLIGIVCVPASLLQHFFDNWLAGNFLCKLVPFLQVAAIATSILTMTCIALERFQGILYPLHVRNSHVLHSSIAMLVAVWLLALAIAAPMWFVQKVEVKYDFLFDIRYICCLEVWPSQWWRRSYTICLSVLVFLVPMVTMAVLYGKIMRELWGKHRIHEAVFQTLPGSEINKITRRKRRAVRMMATVVLLFGTCWAPFHLVSLLLDYEKLNLDLDSEFLLLNLVQILGFSNSVCNPLVYAALNSNFKRDLLALVSRRWGLGLNRLCRGQTQRTESRVRAQPWSKTAWEAQNADNGVAPESNEARSKSFTLMNLFSAIWPSRNSGTVILNVTD
ncbi:pyroglutamylated RF-amide peptide receptor [Trichomycterus rosablanca]|uniref:pyroglutamylated RF-amide peptide receptor n=1 Tax=Trichomycterus rosablanca TaxID=2290929 RepID=UPI002F35CBBB